MEHQLLAVVAKGDKGRVYLAPIEPDQAAPVVSKSSWRPESSLPTKALGFRVQAYGIEAWWQLFSERQLVALSTFSDLLGAVRERVIADAQAAGWTSDYARLREGGVGPTAYADAVVTYLAFAIDKCADYWSTVCSWHNSKELIRNTFGRPAIPMTWDFVECNPFSRSTGNWMAMVDWTHKAVDHLPGSVAGQIVQRDARARVQQAAGAVVSTDPPYYANVGYAGLSDFFFVWLRRNLVDVWPDECATLLTPKTEELVADPDRAGSKTKAEKHFEDGMAEVMVAVAQEQPPGVPATIYYATRPPRRGMARPTPRVGPHSYEQC